MNKKKKRRLYLGIGLAVMLLGFITGGMAYRFQRHYLAARGQTAPDILASWFEWNTQVENKRLGSLSDNQLIQKLVDAAAAPLTTAEIYASIPGFQVNSLGFEDFDQYVSALRMMTKQYELSFTPMTLSEKRAEQHAIERISPDLAKTTENAAFFWIKTAGSYGGTIRLPILLAKNAEGFYYLSGKWIRECLNIYNYSKFYFQALAQRDLETLAAIETTAATSRDVRLKKARLTLDYYRDYVMGAFEQYELISWRMDGIIFRQKLSPFAKGVQTENGQSESEDDEGYTSDVGDYSATYSDLAAGLGVQPTDTRLVYVLAISAGEYEVRDLVPQEFGEKDFSLILPNGELLKPGDWVSDQILSANFGELLASQETGAYGSARTLLYNNVHIVVKNILKTGDSGFGGELESLTVLSPDFSQGRDLRVGNSADQLLLAYPFLDMYSYVALDPNKLYVMSFIMREGEIKGFRLALQSSRPGEYSHLFSRDLRNTNEGIPTPAPTLSPTPTPSPTPSPTPVPSPVPAESGATAKP